MNTSQKLNHPRMKIKFKLTKKSINNIIMNHTYRLQKKRIDNIFLKYGKIKENNKYKNEILHKQCQINNKILELEDIVDDLNRSLDKTDFSEDIHNENIMMDVYNLFMPYILLYLINVD